MRQTSFKKRTIIAIALLTTMIIGLSACVNNFNVLVPTSTTTDTTTPDIPTESPVHVCVFSDWEIIKEATNTQDGLRERRCECGEVQQEIIEVPNTEYYIEYRNLKSAAYPKENSYNSKDGLLNLPQPEAEGYMFVGWYTASIGGELVDHIPQGTHGDITLYAQWEAIVAISASIKTPATKLSYYAGDTLTATGLTVEIRYNDNTVKTVSSSKLSISSVNMTQTGTKTVTASYEGVSVSYTVEVKALTVSLSVSTSTASSGYVTFTASVPAGTVSWKSSDTSVVTINANGVATFKNSVGVATITATVTNGTCTATATKKITLSNTSGTRYGQTSTQTSSTVLYGTRPTGYKTELPVLISIPTYSTNSADITDSNISTSTGMVSTSFVKNGVEGYVYYQFNYSSSSGGDNVNKIIHYTDDWRYNYGNSMSDNFRYYTSYGRQFYSTTNYPEHEANSNWTKYYAIWWAYQDKQAGHTWYVASGINGALAASWYRFPIYNYTKTVTTYTYWYYTIN